MHISLSLLEPAHTEVTDQPQSATQVVPINVSKPKPPSRSRKRKAGKVMFFFLIIAITVFSYSLSMVDAPLLVSFDWPTL